LLLIGNSAMVVLHVVILIGVLLRLTEVYQTSEYIILSIFFVEYMFYGISTYTLSFVYAVETLSERGFSLVMVIYWISISGITTSFKFITKGLNEKDQIFVFGCYIGFGAIILALVLLL